MAKTAQNTVAAEVARLETRPKERDIVTTIVSLQDQFETIRREMLARYRRKIGLLTDEQEEALQALTRGLVNKIAHCPISEISRFAGAEDVQGHNCDRELISVVRRVFRLNNG